MMWCLAMLQLELLVDKLRMQELECILSIRREICVLLGDFNAHVGSREYV